MENKSKETRKGAPVVAGKKSIKDIHADLGFGDVSEYKSSRDKLSLDPELEAELKSKQLVPRYINRAQYASDGYHGRDWVPYRRDSRPKKSGTGNIDSSGYTIHKDLILAVKPVAWNDKHREFLKERTARQANPEAMAAEQMKEQLDRSGYKAKVDTGYGKDE